MAQPVVQNDRKPSLGALSAASMRNVEPMRIAEDARIPGAIRPFEPTLGAALDSPSFDTPAFDSPAPENKASAPAQKPLLDMFGARRAEPATNTEQPDLLAGMEVPPAPPPPLSALSDDSEYDAGRRKRRNRMMAMVAVLVILVGAGWIYLRNKPMEGPPPVITADTTPEKVKPADEGGMQVPNQDVQILDNMASGQSNAGDENKATVMPAPEQPIAPPAAELSEPAGAAPTAPTVTETAPTPPPAPATDTATTENAAPSVAAPAIPAVTAPEPGAAAPPAPIAQSAAPEPAPAAPAETAVTKPADTQTAAAPANPPAATPTVLPAGSVKVQLAAVKSESAAKAQWAKLQKSYPALLGALSLNIEKTVKNGTDYYRIQAGPLNDKAKAKQLCAQLAAQNQACIVAK
jgi:hypothetical protein